MWRTYSEVLQRDLKRKPVILSGPRQCGKTTLGKTLESSFDLLNFDVPKDRKRIIKHDWYRDRTLVVFDEIHKMKKWKTWLKGVFDAEEEKQQFLVTGSARLDTYKKVGDSLAGRYFSHHLYPFDLKELAQIRAKKRIPAQHVFLLKQNGETWNQLVLERLLQVSGFPEPFLTDEQGFHGRWQQTHLDVILKNDILETEQVRQIKQVETLTHLLTERVASPLSYNSLREDLRTDDKSIKRWVDILENNHVVFRIYPYSVKSIAASIKKAPKLYFMDYTRVEDPGARFENFVAFSLLKEVTFRRDVLGENIEINYLRNKQHKEIDFLLSRNKKPYLMIETKEGEGDASWNFAVFEKYLSGVRKVQLVKQPIRGFTNKAGIEVVAASRWLAEMPL